ncbi:MAG: mechanosensitive ion channel family protein [Chitinophagaceae bacterium]|nr:mechanosensitive ion channel family protein [Chitinophagaceae bacterium]
MDFFEQIYFSNTVKSYLVVAGIILFALLVKKYLSRYIIALFLRFAKRIWKTLDKNTFVDKVAQPLGWFVVIVVSVFSIDKLNFPEILDYEIYGHTSRDILSRIGPGIIIFVFTWLLLRLIDFIAGVLEEKANLTVDTRDNQLIIFFRDFLKVIVGICGVLLVIKACFHQPIGNVLTGLSIVGAALALAAKESLENLIASFIIFFDKPFFTGDTVKVNTVTGTVERIGLRSTRIRTADKTLVTVPNKQMVDSVVDNWSLRTERRTEIKLELSAKTTEATLKQITTGIKKILSAYSNRINNSEVFVKDIIRNTILISVEYFTEPIPLNEYFQLKNDINLQVKKLAEDNDAEFAGETSSLVIREDSKEG